MTQEAKIALEQLQNEILRNTKLVENRLEQTDSPSAAVVSAAKYFAALSSLASE